MHKNIRSIAFLIALFLSVVQNLHAIIPDAAFRDISKQFNPEYRNAYSPVLGKAALKPRVYL